MRCSPGKLLHFHAKVGIPALKFRNELRDDFAFATHGPETQRLPLRARIGTGAEQNDKGAKENTERCRKPAHVQHGKAFQRYRLLRKVPLSGRNASLAYYGSFLCTRVARDGNFPELYRRRSIGSEPATSES